MSKEKTGRDLVRQWFDDLEQRLTAEADHAGLLSHSTMTGTAREFFLRNVLSSFLPESVTVGTGKVIGADQVASKQVDIVVFDNRFPSFKMPGGQCLFPVEGTIAAIEVKSQLDTREMGVALDNCLSVKRLRPSILRSDVYDQDRAVNYTDADYRRIRPRTYIFSFRGLTGERSLNDAIQVWLKSAPGPWTSFDLPSVVVSGGAVAIAYDDPISISGAEYRDDATGQIVDDAVLMMLWPSRQRFGWLASHLIYAIDQRRVAQDAGYVLRSGVAGYLPFDKYYTEQTRGLKPLVIGLRPRASAAQQE